MTYISERNFMQIDNTTEEMVQSTPEYWMMQYHLAGEINILWNWLITTFII